MNVFLHFCTPCCNASAAPHLLYRDMLEGWNHVSLSGACALSKSVGIDVEPRINPTRTRGDVRPLFLLSERHALVRRH